MSYPLDVGHGVVICFGQHNAQGLSLGLKKDQTFLLLLLNLCHLMRRKCSAGLPIMVGVEGRKIRDLGVKLAYCCSLKRAAPKPDTLMGKIISHGCMLLRV